MTNDQPPPPIQPLGNPPAYGQPPSQPPPPGSYAPPQPYQQPGELPKKKRSGCLIALAIVGVLGILGVIAIVALIAVAANSVDEAFDQAAEELEVEEEEPLATEVMEEEPLITDAMEEEILEADAEEPEVVDEPLEEPVVEEEGELVVGEADAPAGGDEALDVSNCVIVDEFTVSFDVTNNSSKQSSYIVDANYLDDAGARIGDEPFFVNYIRPASERSKDRSARFPTVRRHARLLKSNASRPNQPATSAR